MKQPKNSKVLLNHETELKTHDGLNLRERFKSLPAKDQQALAHFFNLHNAASFIFQSLTPEAVEYAELCIKFSQEKEQDQPSE